MCAFYRMSILISYPGINFILTGDLQLLDIIIFAGVAAFLLYRLRNVLGRRTGFEKKQNTHSNITPTKDRRIDTMPELPENLSKLKHAYEKIEEFNHKVFLDGAKAAFEMIINAFNTGDKKTLKNLLTPEVYSSFEEAIDANKIDPDYQFYSLNVKNISDVKVETDRVKISVNFISEQFKNNDEKTVIKRQDLWTFEKKIKSKNPNWLLSST